MTEPEFCEVTITAPDSEWLTAFVRDLVAERLCASGHQIDEIRSQYRWRGKQYDRPEAKVMLHTRTDLVARIVERTIAEHPYDVPDVTAVPIVAGNPDYLAWIAAETDSL